jgi:hypothetical protein
MSSTGCDNICGLNRDNSAIRVSDESGETKVGIRVASSICNGSGNAMGGKVGSLCSNNLRGLGRGNGTIGVSNKSAGIGVGSIPSGVSIGVSCIGNGGNTLSGKVSSLCSNNLRGLGGGNSTVGVGDKVDSRGSSHASKENLKCELFLL